MQDDVTTPLEVEAAQGRLRAAIEDEGLHKELFDMADALVRSQINKGNLAPPQDLDTFLYGLISETMITAFENAYHYDPQLRALPWLIGFLKMKLLSHSRDAGRNREDLALDTNLAGELRSATGVESTQEDFFGLLEHEEQERAQPEREYEKRQAEARGAWERLRPKLNSRYADILERRYIGEQSVEEIAEALGISTDHVYTLLSRARNAAKKLDL